jgi:hypothetical protein
MARQHAQPTVAAPATATSCVLMSPPPPVPRLLQKPLVGGDAAAQARVFDLLYNLSIHGELLYDTAAEALPEDAPALADAGGLAGGAGRGEEGRC